MINRTLDIREEKIFLIAYVLWMTDAIVGITMWNDIAIIKTTCDYMQKIAYILLVAQFLLKKRYTKKDVIGVFLIVFMCFLGYHSVYNKYIIHTMILVYMSANVDFRKILKCTLVLHGAFMIITVFASHMEVIENVIWDSDSTRIRQSLGYDYCGYPAHIMLFMTLMWFCLRKKNHVLDVMISVMINYWIYLKTDSRADFYLSLLGIIGFVFLKKQYRLRWWMKYGYIIISIASILIHMVYGLGISFLYKIDALLSSRLQLGYNAIRDYGFNMLGHQIQWFGQGSLRNNPMLIYNYVDCSFLKELLSYGILFWIILVIGFYIVAIVLNNLCIVKYSWAIIIMLLYSVINAHLSMIVFNVFILILGCCFTENNQFAKINRKSDRRRNILHLLLT